MVDGKGCNIQKKYIYGMIFILIGSFVVFYWSTIAGLWHLWSTNDDYSYAFLMPLIFAYIIWQKRMEIARTSLGTNWLGSVSFLVLLTISLYGILGSNPSAVRPAIPLMILSIVLFCFGVEMFKVLAFPLAVLIFMIPLPTLVQSEIGVPLKMMATHLGVLMMRLFGMSVYIEGNMIDLGTIQLQVADACSGLRYILPLFALGFLFAYFFEKVRWRQLVLVLMTIPISIVSNGFRVGMTGILAQYYGLKVTEGIFHDFSGWLVFMIAFSLLFMVQSGLRAIPVRSKGNDHEQQQVRPACTRHSMSLYPLGFCSLLLILSVILVQRTSALPALRLKNGFDDFPMTIGSWQGRLQPLDKETVDLSGAEEAFSAVYTDKSGKIISLYIGYRGSPFNENENFFHSPNFCFPSTGWKVRRLSDRKVQRVALIGDITVAAMGIDKMREKRLVYFWFQTKSRTSSNININRFHLSLHALMMDNTYDLFIRPITPLYPDESIQKAEQRMDEFIKNVLPVLMKYVDGARA